jgi:DNA-binding NtrC family response regulator
MNQGRILVAEDEGSIREMLEDFLDNAGYEVVAVADGEEALARFETGRFDCIVTDLCMPRIDGLELLRRIRARDREIPLLIVTGYPAVDSAMAAIREGAYDYITKPFSMDEMHLKIERAIHVRRTEASLKRVRGFVLTLVLLTPVLLCLGILLGLFWKN